MEERSIVENILVCQDLIKHYNWKNMSSRCLMKIDLCKACDMINWEFIDEVLDGFCFPTTLKKRLLECITTTAFLLVVMEVFLVSLKEKGGLGRETLYLF